MASFRKAKAASLVLCRAERRHASLIIMPEWEQEVWSRYIHTGSEKASEYLIGLMEGITTVKSVNKDWRRRLLTQR